MTTIQEIDELKSYYTTQLYSRVRTEQRTDQTYIDDTFGVPEIKEPHQLYRSGLGTRIVDSPAENVITSNPQVFISPRKQTKENQSSADRLAEVVNTIWIPTLQKQNPNPFKEFVKALLGRGEAYIKVVHNERWVTGDKDKAGLPAHFIILDPYVIYGSPEEDMEGIPDKVIVWYDRQYRDVIIKYPEVPKPQTSETNLISWLEYYDRGSRYMVAGNTPTTIGGIQPNLYGFTPFVRKYSGFGRRNFDGELASLIVSDIKRSRDLIREECAVRSNLASIDFLFAHRPRTIIAKGLDPETLRDNISYGAYDVNYVDALPAEVKVEDMNIVPDSTTYKHHADIVAELNQRHPFIMSGFPFGSSGRQQDMTQVSAMRRYDSIVDNTENAFATAIKMAWKECKVIPGLLPDGIQEKDLELNYDIQVKLKAKDPIEEDRAATLGSRLYSQGQIDLETNLVKYQGYTKTEAENIITNILVELVTFKNPAVAQVLGRKAAEKAGLADEIAQAEQESAQQQKQQTALMRTPPTSSMDNMVGEVGSPEGRNMIDMALSNNGQRNPPDRYFRSNDGQ